METQNVIIKKYSTNLLENLILLNILEEGPSVINANFVDIIWDLASKNEDRGLTIPEVLRFVLDLEAKELLTINEDTNNWELTHKGYLTVVTENTDYNINECWSLKFNINI